MINYRTIARQLTFFIRQFSPLSVDEMCPITLSILCLRFAAYDRSVLTHGKVDLWDGLLTKIGKVEGEPKYMLQDALSEAGDLFEDRQMYELYDRAVGAVGRLPKGDFCREYVKLIDELARDYCAASRRAGLFNHLLLIHGGRYIETVPADIGTLMAQLIRRTIRQRDGLRLYDPACGVGSMGIHVLLRNKSNFSSLAMMEESVLQADMARLNLFVNGINTYELRNEDFLKDGWGPNERYDVIVSMPAWGQRRKIDAPKQEGLKIKYTGVDEVPYDYACILRGLESLEVYGLMVMAMPMGVLTQQGIGETVRREFIRHQDLRAVIGMPVNMLYSTSVAFALLVFQHAEKRNDVLMINAKDLYEGHGRLNRMAHHDQQRIVHAFTSNRSIDGLSRMVSYEEIAQNNFNLLPSHYVSDPTAEQRNISEKIKEINELTAQMRAITREHNEYLRLLGLPELEA